MPLGANRITLLAKSSTAAATSSWADWTTSEVGTIQETSYPTNSQDQRGGALLLFSDDALAGVTLQNANPSLQKIDLFDISGNTLTYDDTTDFTEGGGFRVNWSYGISFPTYNKGFVPNTSSTTLVYYRLYYYNTSTKAITSSGQLTMTTSSGTIQDIWNTACQLSSDETKWASCGRDGRVRAYSFDNSTNTVSEAAYHDISNCTASTAHTFMIENSGTEQIAVVYVDSSDSYWKVWQADIDGLTNQATTSLGVTTGTFNPGHGSTSHTTHQVPCSKLLLAGIWSTGTDNLPLWTVNWDDATNSWSTDASTTTFNLSPNTNYTLLAYSRSPRTHLGDNVWAFFCLYRNNTVTSIYYPALHIFELSGSSTITELGTVDLSPKGTPNTYGLSNPDDKGIVMSTDRTKLYIMHDDGLYGQYRSVHTIYKPS